MQVQVQVQVRAFRRFVRRRELSTLTRATLSLLLLTAPVSAQLGFLGPRGTFSEEAADTFRRSATEVGEAVPFETMTAVVEALGAGRISRGILPVASTVAGFPEESSRLFLSAPDPGFRVIAEIVVPVELHLLVKPGTSRARIKKILSHPNALGESKSYRDAHYPGVAREETSSTAAAAERVAEADGSLAAVASAAAGRLYRLEVLDRSIQEDSRNATSFWVIARPDDARGLDEAVHLVVLLEAPPGSPALSATVASLHEAGLEVLFVNSKPVPGGLYGFRYLLSLSAPRPVSRNRVDLAIREGTAAGGRALRIGWFD
jgi:prephenate dehydratase